MSAIRHHFLPQVYLRRFISPKKKNLLWEFDKRDGSFRESTPKRSGCHDHFYTFTNTQGRRDNESLERKFHEIENRIPKLYEALRTEENPLSDETAFTFVLFAASMFIRVPRYIHRVGSLETAKLREALEQARKDPEFIARVESNGIPGASLEHATVEADPNYVLISAIRGLIIPAKPFAQMSWQFVKAPAGTYFITGDHPVIHCNPKISHALFAVELEDPAVEVTFPLSRSLCALGRWSDLRGRYGVADVETVRIINRRTYLAAHRHVYSPTDDCELWEQT